MAKFGRLRRHAEQAIFLAARSNNSAYRAVMFKIAQDWLDLAQQAEAALYGVTCRRGQEANEDAGQAVAHMRPEDWA